MKQRTLFDIALEYTKQGKLKSTKSGPFTLFCYTQDTFFEKDAWDDITTSHRGALYYNGIAVNKPFKKIFNLDEVSSTALSVIEDRMRTQKYEIYDKANGHLFIVSCFVDEEGEQQVMFHTKGSLPGEGNDLLNTDIDIFLELHGNNLAAICSSMPVGTYMFEAIVEHDKHTLYKEQCDFYGINKNGFVLLSANIMVPDYDGDLKWFECDYEALSLLSNGLGCYLNKRYDPSTLDQNITSWFDHSSIEGYVIKFEDGFRVKIKTKEYWALRFKKDLTADKILQMFNSAGFERIRSRLPEEVSGEIESVLQNFFKNWYYIDYVKVDQITDYLNDLTVDRAEIAKNTKLTSQQKTHLFAVYSGRTLDFTRSKLVRTEFMKFMYKNQSHMDDLQSRIEDIVNSI